MQVVAEQDIVTDRNRQRVGSLEHHADLLAYLHQFYGRVIDVMTEYVDTAVDAHITQPLVDAVNAAQEGGFAAARGADHGGDDSLLDFQVDIEQCLESSIPEIQITGPYGQLCLIFCYCLTIWYS